MEYEDSNLHIEFSFIFDGEGNYVAYIGKVFPISGGKSMVLPKEKQLELADKIAKYSKSKGIKLKVNLEE